MPTIACSICNRLQTIKLKERKYLILDDVFVCSRDCVLEWITRHMAKVQDDGPGVWWSAQRVRHPLNQEFRSNFERVFAGFLEAEGIRWLYEEWRFKVRNSLYFPDFYLPDFGCFIETKGLWTASQRTKFKNFRVIYPEVPLLVVSWLLNGAF